MKQLERCITSLSLKKHQLKATETIMLLTENISRLWASLIAHECKVHGIKNIFLAPGMRNAPLIAAFTSDDTFHCHVGHDERGLAYKALGASLASHEPSLLICTSGTAGANFYPAVIEAKKSMAPLIVLTADRPLELSQTDANQTIAQANLYGEFSKHNLNLGVADSNMEPAALLSLMGHAIETAKQTPAGPVHINIAFREPLDASETKVETLFLEKSKRLITNNSIRHNQLTHQTLLHPEVIDLVAKAKAPLFIIGNLKAKSLRDQRKDVVDTLRRCPYPLNIDVTSSLKFDFTSTEGLIPTFDHPEVYEHFLKNKPDLLIHFGGRLTSKHYYRFLKETSGEFPVIHISEQHELSDSGFAITHKQIMDPTDAILQLGHKLQWQNDQKNGCDFRSFIQRKIEVIESSDKVAFPYLSKRLIEMIPNHHTLAIGNSTFIRSFDSYVSIDQPKALDVLTHRGVSGIEGFFASSAGYASVTGQPLTLALGDVSAIHDLNSLHFVKQSQTPIIAIVANNYGGGIFRLLNLKGAEQLYPVLTSPHEIQFAPIAKAFGLEATQVSTRAEFEAVYTAALKSETSQLIEVFVKNESNEEIYKQLKTIKLP